jgi:hypothetical protein
MLEFDIHLGDVLSCDAGAVIVPIDGTFVPHDGGIERLLGNIGRQFVRRFPDAELLELIASQLDLPLPLGEAANRALVRTSFLAAAVAADDPAELVAESLADDGGAALGRDDVQRRVAGRRRPSQADLRPSTHGLSSMLTKDEARTCCWTSTPRGPTLDRANSRRRLAAPL